MVVWDSKAEAGVRALADRGVYLGTSSWIYQGWIGQIYCDDYSGPRKSFVKSRFEKSCLEEYARTFRTVCFDGAYYRFPTPGQLRGYAEQLPEGFRLAMKATDSTTIYRHRADTWFGAKKGEYNKGYLDANTFEEQFVDVAEEALGSKLGPIIFEFSPFHFDKPWGVRAYSPHLFVTELDRFLARLPRGPMYSVEVRDPVFLLERSLGYLDMLRSHNASHVLNEQTWMPVIAEQLEVDGIFTADFIVSRVLTRPGLSHEAAVQEFEPYNETRAGDETMRSSLARLLHEAIRTRRGLYMYVNNRREGNAPNTIAGVVEIARREYDLN